MHDGKHVAAVIQATKTGFLYTFDRESGTPVFPIVEKPVPQDAVPGEHPSPTQPYPVAPPALARQTPVTADDAWGVAWFDTRACRARIEGYRSEGIFQPPSLKDSLMQPGNAGGSNWGGIAFDPKRQTGDRQHHEFAFRGDVDNARPTACGSDVGSVQGLRVRPAERHALRHAPCRIQIQSGYSLRKTTVGIADGRRYGARHDQVADPPGRHAFHSRTVGLPGIGGPIVTAGGLVFIGASLDDRLRAFDTDTGKLLWEVKLPAGGQATPMTYAIDGRQYLVIAAGGYKGDSTRGDFLVAYALP